ncbi:MAG: hypothetical protein HY721_08125 [Planctomycetes bacterium]|nr:hypothetical protein [Planctomycetota bacterium]
MDCRDELRFEGPRARKPIALPSELYSFCEEGPFQACSACCRSLGDGGLYQVQKVIRGKEVIFEMAICEACAQGLCCEFSEESLQAIKGFLLSSFKPSPETCHCHFCGFPRPLLSGYTLVGTCSSRFLVVPTILLCDRCGEQLQARISNKTREVQEDFVRSTFPGVPADMDVSPTFGGIL